MREIKFRGMCCGKWVIGNYQLLDGRAYIKSFERNQRFGCGFVVEPESVGQYTGLKDKNGVEIYEGDITETAVNNCKWRGIISTVDGFGQNLYNVQFWQNFDPNNDTNFYKWGDFSCFIRSNLCGMLNSVSIVGNIHEHPHLLDETCRRCQTPLVPGQALQNQCVAHPDFLGDTGNEAGSTRSFSGDAKMVDVLKCPSCGYSRTA